MFSRPHPHHKLIVVVTSSKIFSKYFYLVRFGFKPKLLDTEPKKIQDCDYIENPFVENLI
jgi:hypothetical protein